MYENIDYNNIHSTIKNNNLLPVNWRFFCYNVYQYCISGLGKYMWFKVPFKKFQARK